MVIDQTCALHEEKHGLLKLLERGTEQRSPGDPDQVFAWRDLI